MANKIKSRIWLPSGEICTVELSPDYYMLPNFRVRELANNQAKDEIKFEIPDARAWLLLKMLQLTRDRFGPMTLSSVYRTKAFNSTTKGADPNSCHLVCWAFDWLWPGMTDADRKTATDWWRNLCRDFEQIGAINYYDGRVHCEIGSDIRFGLKSFKIRDYR